MKKLTIEFDNEMAMDHFTIWLSELGEQDYWLWMECREGENKEGDITAISFDYWTKKKDATIVAKCGRMDGDY